MLAPEEVYSLPSHSVSIQGSASERVAGESRKLHDARRAEKKKKNDLLDKVREVREMNKKDGGGATNSSGLGTKNRMRIGDEKKEKEKALKGLMGNKGVSVIGKGEKKNVKGGKEIIGKGKGKAKERSVDHSNKNWKL